MTTTMDNSQTTILSGNEITPWQRSGLSTSTWRGEAPSSRQIGGMQRSLLQLFGPLVNLYDNWDGHFGCAPKVEELENAARLVTKLLEEAPGSRLANPEVIASVDGGVIVDWETQDISLQLSFNDGVDVFVRIDGLEQEGPLGYHVDLVREAMGRLIHAN